MWVMLTWDWVGRLALGLQGGKMWGGKKIKGPKAGP